MQENSTKISALSDELSVIRKVVEGISAMQSDIAALKSDVQDIKDWKAQTEGLVSKFNQFFDLEWPLASRTISDLQ